MISRDGDSCTFRDFTVFAEDDNAGAGMGVFMGLALAKDPVIASTENSKVRVETFASARSVCLLASLTQIYLRF